MSGIKGNHVNSPLKLQELCYCTSPIKELQYMPVDLLRQAKQQGISMQ